MAIERRESHLWITALVLLIAFVISTLLVVHVILVGNPQAGEVRPSLIPAVVALSALVLLFCFYVIYSRVSLAKVRRLYESQAVRDSLTGLLNRRSFGEQMRRAMATAGYI